MIYAIVVDLEREDDGDLYFGRIKAKDVFNRQRRERGIKKHSILVDYVEDNITLDRELCK